MTTTKDGTAPGGPPPHIDQSRDTAMTDQHNSIFFAAVKTTRMPMIVTDPRQPDNPIVFANPAFINMTGYGEDELLGRNCRFLQGPDTDPETVAEVRRALEQKREVSVDILNYKKNGASFWNALFISPVYDEAGEVIYFFASQLDISRRRDAEDSLRQAQKMEAVGQLTGGIAHDFNNLLTVIQGFTDILHAQLREEAGVDPAKARRAVNAISQAAERGSALTQQLLAFARKQKLQGRVVNLNELVTNLEPLIEQTSAGRVQIETRLSQDICNARIDPVQAEMALMNLLINARDAMPDGGVIHIESRICEVGEEDQGELKPGSYAELAVRDHGFGMSPEVLQRVVEPFFTTKEQGKGTGLGLSMVYGFVRQSGGALLIESKPGQGTVARMLFPCDAADADAAKAAPQVQGARARGETVLVVEDQIDVGDYAQAVLEEFGYRVLRADEGRGALDILDREGSIDLLFTDLIMPGAMNGVLLAREARKRRPRIKVLLTTGYAEASIERVDARGAEFELISKPYRRTELAAKVRQVIEGPTGVG